LKGIQLDAPAPEGLAARAVLIADRLRLQQCMQNGMSNAINFTERGKSVRLRTAVELIEERPGWAQLTVSIQDEGIGLSENELGALGEDLMFTQVGRGQMQGNGGTGLGLPIVRELLRKHSGLLVLSSEGYGKGTCFEMRVDCEIDSTVAPDLEQPSALKAVSAEPLIVEQRFPDGYRALHVEDDAFVRFTVPLQTFQPLGVAYEQVEDGTEALELVRAGQKFHCIVIDNHMPRMGGAETTRALRAMGYSGLILGMTGDPFGCEERYAFEASGLDACLNKDSAGMSECVKLMKLHAARLLLDAERALVASRESDTKRQPSVSSAGKRSPSTSAAWLYRPSRHSPTATQGNNVGRSNATWSPFGSSRLALLKSGIEPVGPSSAPMRSRFVLAYDRSDEIWRLSHSSNSQPTRLASRVAPVDPSTSPLESPLRVSKSKSRSSEMSKPTEAQGKECWKSQRFAY